MESFYTIQGEGHYSGHAAYFIRLGGCDVGCVWCDVKESWPMEGHHIKSVQNLCKEVEDSGSEICVITGGEPLMYEMNALTRSLKDCGIKTHMETSGAHPLSGDWDWICLSPKKFKKPLKEVCEKAHELKVIVFNKSDFKWAKEYQEKVSENCLLFLQPEYSREKEMLPLIIDFVKKNPKWRISLQTHKMMNIP